MSGTILAVLPFSFAGIREASAERVAGPEQAHLATRADRRSCAQCGAGFARVASRSCPCLPQLRWPPNPRLPPRLVRVATCSSVARLPMPPRHLVGITIGREAAMIGVGNGRQERACAGMQVRRRKSVTATIRSYGFPEPSAFIGSNVTRFSLDLVTPLALEAYRAIVSHAQRHRCLRSRRICCVP
jgi:hypothetical protein